jgi:magnesium chelatase subunit I
MKPYIFPFSALVGQEKLKTGLLLNAVDPAIGGIVISGHKGTGKSTAVRALSRVLPEITVVADCPYNCAPEDMENLCPSCHESLKRGETLHTIRRPMPLVELPLSATEDRVIGTLHVERILKTGERIFEPGLLASANRGILYVDEVNLLDDHLVDILLDAAASGVNLVERESISFSHPSRFMLIGTMNPEEGELRPQFLDRFGLSLSVTSVADPLLRHRLVERRIAFDRDPRSFCSTFSDEESMLSSQIRLARQGVAEIRIPPSMIEMAVTLAGRVQAQGHRAEITIIKAARALAALLECSEIEEQHILEAARYVLPHRMTTLSLATAGQIEQALEDLFRQVFAEDSTAEPTGEASREADSWDDLPEAVPGATAASNVSMLFNFLAEKKKLFTSRIN